MYWSKSSTAQLQMKRWHGDYEEQQHHGVSVFLES
jgi:hypothetical protein